MRFRRLVAGAIVCMGGVVASGCAATEEDQRAAIEGLDATNIVADGSFLNFDMPGGCKGSYFQSLQVSGGRLEVFRNGILVTTVHEMKRNPAKVRNDAGVRICYEPAFPAGK